MDLEGAGHVTPEAAAAHARRDAHMSDPEAATRALAEMSMSKTAVLFPAEPVVVVEPGGLARYRRAVHERFVRGDPAPRTPDAWKRELFEDVLGQDLDDPGGERLYDPDSLEPMSLLPELAQEP
jgi:hypothetical protein